MEILTGFGDKSERLEEYSFIIITITIVIMIILFTFEKYHY